MSPSSTQDEEKVVVSWVINLWLISHSDAPTAAEWEKGAATLLLNDKPHVSSYMLYCSDQVSGFLEGIWVQVTIVRGFVWQGVPSTR